MLKRQIYRKQLKSKENSLKNLTKIMNANYFQYHESKLL